MSDSLITWYISPSVPSSFVNPAASASFIEAEPSRNPTVTRMSEPSSDSRRFRACAGPCDDQPMTPIREMPPNALGRRGNRWRPPATMVSSRSASRMVRVSNTFEVKATVGSSGVCESVYVPGAESAGGGPLKERSAVARFEIRDLRAAARTDVPALVRQASSPSLGLRLSLLQLFSETERIVDGRQLDLADPRSLADHLAISEQSAGNALPQVHFFEPVQVDFVGLPGRSSRACR